MDFNTIIKFWFKDIDSKKWFEKDDNFDQLLKDRFNSLVKLALDDNLVDWKVNIEGNLALIILLDQFTRNIFRNQPRSFSGDPVALSLSFLTASTNLIV